MTYEENHQARVRAVTGISLVVASAGVTCRLVSRRLKGQRLYLDDWLLVVALLFEWAVAIAGLLRKAQFSVTFFLDSRLSQEVLKSGLGKHMRDVKDADLVTYLKILYSGAPLYAVTVVAVKLSMLFLYRRLFPAKRMIYAAFAVGVVVIIWGVIVSLLGFMLCIPIHKIWEPQTPGWCLNLVPFYYGAQIPNIITDVVIVVMPLRIVLGLGLDKKQKIGLGIVFGLCTIVVIMDVIRLVALVELAGLDMDVTWDQVPAAIWTCLEPATAIACAGFSSSKPVFEWLAHYYRPAIYPTVSNAVAEIGNGFGTNGRSLFTTSRDGTLPHHSQHQVWASQPYQADHSLPSGLDFPNTVSCRQHPYPYSHDRGVVQSSGYACSTAQASNDTMSHHTSDSCNYLTSPGDCGGRYGDIHISHQASSDIMPAPSSDHKCAPVDTVKRFESSPAWTKGNAEDRKEEEQQQLLSIRDDTRRLPPQLESSRTLKKISMRMKALPRLPVSVAEADNELEQRESGSPELWRRTRKSRRDGEHAKRKSVVSQQWFFS